MTSRLRTHAIAPAALAALIAAATACSGPGATPADQHQSAAPHATTHLAVDSHPPHSHPPQHPATVRRTASEFQPYLVNAISPRRLLVLSSGDCGPSTCRGRLDSSTDDGRRWRVISRDLPLLDNGAGQADTVSDMTFSDADDGWLFGSALWATHDGGRRWRHIALPGVVEQLGLGEGSVWVIVGRGRLGHRFYRLMRASMDSDRFTDVRLPVPLGRDGSPPALSVSATTIAVLNTLQPSQRHDSADLELSVDGGATWSTAVVPCVRELGGQLSVADSAVWGTCPTGLEEFAFRFADGAFGYQDPDRRPLSSADSIIGLSADSAVLETPLDRAYWTADAGRHWRRSRLPRRSVRWYLADLSFSDPGVGFGIYVGSRPTRLVRTDNAGRSWTLIGQP